MITKATAAVYMDPTLKLIQRQRTTQSRSHGTVLNVNCDSNVASCFRCMCVIRLGAFQLLPVRVSELTQQFYIVFFCLFMFTFTLFSHIMKELIATERIYVDELLSVLLVSQFRSFDGIVWFVGYFIIFIDIHICIQNSNGQYFRYRGFLDLIFSLGNTDSMRREYLEILGNLETTGYYLVMIQLFVSFSSLSSSTSTLTRAQKNKSQLECPRSGHQMTGFPDLFCHFVFLDFFN